MKDFGNIMLNFSQIKTLAKEDVDIDHLMGVHACRYSDMDYPASLREVKGAIGWYFKSIGITPYDLDRITPETRATLKNDGYGDEYTESFKLFGLYVTVEVVLIFKLDGTPAIGIKAERNA